MTNLTRKTLLKHYRYDEIISGKTVVWNAQHTKLGIIAEVIDERDEPEVIIVWPSLHEDGFPLFDRAYIHSSELEIAFIG